MKLRRRIRLACVGPISRQAFREDVQNDPFESPLEEFGKDLCKGEKNL